MTELRGRTLEPEVGRFVGAVDLVDWGLVVDRVVGLAVGLVAGLVDGGLVLLVVTGAVSAGVVGAVSAGRE